VKVSMSTDTGRVKSRSSTGLMCRFLITTLFLLSFLQAAVFAAPTGPISGWEWTYTSETAAVPPEGPWRPLVFPARFPVTADVPGALRRTEAAGYIWLRTVVEVEEPSAVLLGPLGFSERVYGNGILIGAAGSIGKDFSSPLGGIRGYPLPFNRDSDTVRLTVRLYHPGVSWLARQPELVALENLERAELKRNIRFWGQLGLSLYLTVLFAIALYVFFLQRRWHWIFAAGVCLVSGAGLVVWGPLSRALPLLPVLQLHSSLQASTASLLLVFAAEFLALFRRRRVLLAAVAPVLVGIVGFLIPGIGLLLRYRLIEVVVILTTLGAGAVLAGLGSRKKPLQGGIALAFFLIAGATLLVPLLRGEAQAALLGAGSGVALAVASYMTWLLASDRFTGHHERAEAIRELQRRVRAEEHATARLKDGRSRLENRNLDSIILANRLVESAQKQVQSISQIMASIEEGATAESGVMVTERQILDLTGDVDTRIADFNEQITGALKELQSLQTTSRTITQAVSQIIGIADKTNMLSLNASIEATKAGEAGRGFGVVAHQVRKLADVTRDVSDQVGGLIRESNRAVEKNVHMATEMSKGYREIMHQSEKIRQMLEQNFRALEEVTKAHGRIQDGVAGLDRTIRTVLEVSRDLREMTSGLAGEFGWLDELIAEESGGKSPELEVLEGAEGVKGRGIEPRPKPAGRLPQAEASDERVVAEPSGGGGPLLFAEVEELTDSAAVEDTEERRAVDKRGWEAELASVVPDELLGGDLVVPSPEPLEEEPPVLEQPGIPQGSTGDAEEAPELEELAEPETLVEAVEAEQVEDRVVPDVDELGASADRLISGWDRLPEPEQVSVPPQVAPLDNRSPVEPSTPGGSKEPEALEELAAFDELEESAALDELEEIEEI
jgi:methyl-accepting chemotaxis protein